MEAAKTPFGTVTFPGRVSTPRRKATIKAMNWCMTIINGNPFWELTPEQSAGCGKGITRKVGQNTLTVFPLLAAQLDLGYGEAHRFSSNHVPVEINGNKVCVTSANRRSRPLHTDMVASILQLFCVEKPPLKFLPSTLGLVLYPEDYPALVTRARAVNDELRNELFHTFRTRAVNVAAAIEHIENELVDEEWIELRNRFPWEEMPDVALHIASSLMTPHRSAGDWLWVMNILERFDHAEYVAFFLPNLLTHFHTSVVLRALHEYRPQTPDEAWFRISPLLGHESPMVQRLAHQKLAVVEELEEDLVQASLHLVVEAGEPRMYNETLRNIVAWLSHRMDADAWIEPMLPSLALGDLIGFLKAARIHGTWFETMAAEYIAQPYANLHVSVVLSSASIKRIDHYNLWKPLMERGRSGHLQKLVLNHLSLLTKEQAYRFIDMAAESKWRFVLAKVVDVVVNQYPAYPRRRSLLEHLAQTSTSYRLRQRCQRHLEAMEG